MAKARMVSQAACDDARLDQLSDRALALFFLAITQLDRDGLMDGRPSWVAGHCVPGRTHWHHEVGMMINEWVTLGLCVRYEGSNGPVLFFPAFRKHNANLPYEKEQDSRFPPPPGYHRDAYGKFGLIPNDPVEAGRLSQQFDVRSTYGKALAEAAKRTETLAESLGLRDPSDDLHKKVATSSRPHRDQVVTKRREDQDQTEVEAEENSNNNMRARVQPEPETETDVVVALKAFGLSEKSAEELAEKYSPEHIEEKIAYLQYLIGYRPEKVKSPRGWLRTAIENDYGPPDGFRRGDVDAERRREYSSMNYLLRPLEGSSP